MSRQALTFLNDAPAGTIAGNSLPPGGGGTVENCSASALAITRSTAGDGNRNASAGRMRTKVCGSNYEPTMSSEDASTSSPLSNLRFTSLPATLTTIPSTTHCARRREFTKGARGGGPTPTDTRVLSTNVLPRPNCDALRLLLLGLLKHLSPPGQQLLCLDDDYLDLGD